MLQIQSPETNSFIKLRTCVQVLIKPIFFSLFSESLTFLRTMTQIQKQKLSLQDYEWTLKIYAKNYYIICSSSTVSGLLLWFLASNQIILYLLVPARLCITYLNCCIVYIAEYLVFALCYEAYSSNYFFMIFFIQNKKQSLPTFFAVLWYIISGSMATLPFYGTLSLVLWQLCRSMVHYL